MFWQSVVMSTSQKQETRAADNVYLIGSYVPEIFGSKLPSYPQTFGHLLHLHKFEKK